MSAAPNGDWAKAGAHRLHETTEPLLEDGGSRRPAIRWHIGREISLAVLAVLVFQTVALVWWAATLDRRVIDLEAARLERAAQDVRGADDRDATHARLAALEAEYPLIL